MKQHKMQTHSTLFFSCWPRPHSGKIHPIQTNFRSHLLCLADPTSEVATEPINKADLFPLLDFDAEVSIYDRTEHVTALIQTPGVGPFYVRFNWLPQEFIHIQAKCFQSSAKFPLKYHERVLSEQLVTSWIKLEHKSSRWCIPLLKVYTVMTVSFDQIPKKTHSQSTFSVLL